MKRKNLFRIVCILLSPFILMMAACDQELPTSSISENPEIPELAVKIKSFDPLNTTLNYPQSSSVNVRFFSNYNSYSGANLSFTGGTKLRFLHGVLTPPQGTPPGSAVVITGIIDYDIVNDELIFTFGPSGCQFNPAAALWLKYEDLVGNGVPNLYYIDDNGNYVLQVPDEVNTQQKWLKIYINHFSRYAVAYGR